MDNPQTNSFYQGWKRGARLVERGLDALVHPAHDRFSRIIAAIFLFGLVVYGVRLWGVFYSWGNLSFDFLDWAEIVGPRYALLRDAAVKGILPLHAANTTALRGVTDRYFSIADTPFSPQYLLLPWMELGQYLLLDTLVFYGLGCLGLIGLYKKYHLSPLAFLLLFFLFFFNGNMTSHLAVGHSNWAAQFLLPYFVLLVFHLVERGRVGWKWVTALAVLMAVLLMQGAFHQYLWCLIFLAVLALVNWRLIKPVLVGGAATLLVTLPRLLPPSLALAGITQPYQGGFPSVMDLWNGLVQLQDPVRAVKPITDTFPLNPWEMDFYIGLLGLAFVVFFGIVVPLKRDRTKQSFQVQILIPCLVLTALSIGQVYARVFSIFRVPPFTGERVTSRIFILPLVFVLALAVIFFQQELARRKLPSWGQILALGGGYLVFHDLFQHMQAWRIRYLDAMVNLFPKMPFDPAQHTLQNHADPVYVGMLVGGAGVALVTLAALGWLAWRKNDLI